VKTYRALHSRIKETLTVITAALNLKITVMSPQWKASKYELRTKFVHYFTVLLVRYFNLLVKVLKINERI
jgi:hypothetical protein